MENSIQLYLDFISNAIYDYFKILLGSKYEKGLLKTFVTKYMNVRYYNDSIYKDKDITSRISKELNLVAKELIKANKDKEELIKNIIALFTYLLYFDDVIKYENLNELIDTLFNDQIITLEYEEDLKKDFKIFIKDIISKKEKYYSLFITNDFVIKNKRIKKNVYKVHLDHNITISKLYSDYAIDKAYNEGIIEEDKLFVLINMLSYNILKDAINLDFSKNYIIDLPLSYLTKNKKMMRLFKLFDNGLLKTRISFKINYETYKKDKEIINNYINLGFSITLELDNTFDNDFESLILFSYVLVYEYLECYDIINESKDTIQTCIVTM